MYHTYMTFIGKVQALRAAFRVPDNVPFPQAIVEMSQSMGLPHEVDVHSLAEQGRRGGELGAPRARARAGACARARARAGARCAGG